LLLLFDLPMYIHGMYSPTHFQTWNNFCSLLVLIYNKLLIIQVHGAKILASIEAQDVAAECLENGNLFH
jgi:hypothetical protein